jgi:hypothetical protein
VLGLQVTAGVRNRLTVAGSYAGTSGGGDNDKDDGIVIKVVHGGATLFQKITPLSAPEPGDTFSVVIGGGTGWYTTMSLSGAPGGAPGTLLLENGVAAEVNVWAFNNKGLGPAAAQMSRVVAGPPSLDQENFNVFDGSIATERTDEQTTKWNDGIYSVSIATGTEIGDTGGSGITGLEISGNYGGEYTVLAIFTTQQVDDLLGGDIPAHLITSSSVSIKDITKVKIKAQNTHGWSEGSVEYDVTPRVASNLGSGVHAFGGRTAANFKVFAGAAGGDGGGPAGADLLANQMKITWEKPVTPQALGGGVVVGYGIYISDASTGDRLSSHPWGPDQTEMVINDLTPGTEYKVRINVDNGSGYPENKYPSDGVSGTPSTRPIAKLTPGSNANDLITSTYVNSSNTLRLTLNNNALDTDSTTNNPQYHISIHQINAGGLSPALAENTIAKDAAATNGNVTFLVLDTAATATLGASNSGNKVVLIISVKDTEFNTTNENHGDITTGPDITTTRPERIVVNSITLFNTQSLPDFTETTTQGHTDGGFYVELENDPTTNWADASATILPTTGLEIEVEEHWPQLFTQPAVTLTYGDATTLIAGGEVAMVTTSSQFSVKLIPSSGAAAVDIATANITFASRKATIHFGLGPAHAWALGGGYRIRVELSNLKNGVKYRIKHNLIGTDVYGNEEDLTGGAGQTGGGVGTWFYPQGLPSMTFQAGNDNEHSDEERTSLVAAAGSSGNSVRIQFNGGQMYDLFEFSSAGGAGGVADQQLEALSIGPLSKGDYTWPQYFNRANNQWQNAYYTANIYDYDYITFPSHRLLMVETSAGTITHLTTYDVSGSLHIEKRTYPA